MVIIVYQKESKRINLQESDFIQSAPLSIRTRPVVKATPHKDRLTALWHICLHIFRHLAHKFLDIRQYACEIYAQSAEKSDCASAPQSLCGVALIISYSMFHCQDNEISQHHIPRLYAVPSRPVPVHQKDICIPFH